MSRQFYLKRQHVWLPGVGVVGVDPDTHPLVGLRTCLGKLNHSNGHNTPGDNTLVISHESCVLVMVPRYQELPSMGLEYSYRIILK